MFFGGLLGGEEGVKAVQFILGRWVEAVGMCLRVGDNVATRNPRSSAETLCASISLLQLELFQTENCTFLCHVYSMSHYLYRPVSYTMSHWGITGP